MSQEVIKAYQKKLNEINNLPTLPIIATEIMRITRNDNYSARQIQGIIEKDPPLAMKILKVANSAHYGVKKPVKSLRHAVVIIGMKQLSNIAISFSVLKRFENSSSNIDWEKFWVHSIGVGFLTELLTEDYSIATSESPYTMGLLHDVGKLVLNILDAEKYHSIYQEVQRTKKTFYEVEKSTLGITHSEVGKILAEKWKMSDKLVDVVAHHHEVEDSKPENIIINAVVEIADHLCNITEMSFGTDFDTDSLPEPQSWSILQENISELKNKKYEEFIDEIGSQIQSISEMVNLIQL